MVTVIPSTPMGPMPVFASARPNITCIVEPAVHEEGRVSVPTDLWNEVSETARSTSGFVLVIKELAVAGVLPGHPHINDVESVPLPEGRNQSVETEIGDPSQSAGSVI